jgi:hypothetical protein
MVTHMLAQVNSCFISTMSLRATAALVFLMPLMVCTTTMAAPKFGIIADSQSSTSRQSQAVSRAPQRYKFTVRWGDELAAAF